MNDRLLVLKDARYLGSHPAAEGEIKALDLEIWPDSFEFRKFGELLGEITWDYVSAVMVDSRESIEARVTLPRALLLGGLAWVAKKQKMISYLAIEDVQGVWMFAIPDVSAIELEAKVAAVASRIGLVQVDHSTFLSPARAAEESGPEPVAAPSASAADRLRQIRELLDAGLLTEAEYQERRAAIVNEL